MTRDPLRGAWLARQLDPVRVHLFARLQSTNEWASAALESGRMVAPAVIAASRQTAGRGRNANQWWSDAGSLCASFILPAQTDIPIGQIPLRAGLAVATLISRLLPAESVRVKWPNDVYVNDRKVAGLLCARIRESDMIGVGLNVFTDLNQAPGDIRKRATTLSHHMRHPPHRDELLRDLWKVLQEIRFDRDWMSRYHQMHMLHEKLIRITTEDGTVSGTCTGIDDQGRLLLKTISTIRKMTSGTVEF